MGYTHTAQQKSVPLELLGVIRSVPLYVSTLTGHFGSQICCFRFLRLYKMRRTSMVLSITT